MDLVFSTEATVTAAAPALKYTSLLQDGLSVPYQNAHGVASLLARDLSLALFFMMTSYRGRPSYPKALFHCDFEDGWCPGFEPSKNSDIPWNLWKGRTPSNKTGPAVDHTRFNKDGTYIYLEASNQRLGDTAVFKTPPVMMLDHPRYCLRYWYHMKGSTTGSLWIYWNAAVGEYRIHSVIDKQLGERSRNGTDWKERQVSVTSTHATKYYRPVVFEFRAIRGTGYTGDIAVDDVLLLPGDCQKIVFSKTATTMTFRGITTTPQPNTTTTQSWKARNPAFSVCGDDFYHTGRQRCCKDTALRAATHHHRCCGNKLFHQIYQKCCNGYPITTNAQGCCMDRIVFTRSKRACCEGHGTYDLIAEECVNGKIRDRKPVKIKTIGGGKKGKGKNKGGKGRSARSLEFMAYLM